MVRVVSSLMVPKLSSYQRSPLGSHRTLNPERRVPVEFEDEVCTITSLGIGGTTPNPTVRSPVFDIRNHHRYTMTKTSTSHVFDSSVPMAVDLRFVVEPLWTPGPSLEGVSTRWCLVGVIPLRVMSIPQSR